MNGEHLQSVRADAVNGRTKIVFQFNQTGAEAIFTPGESVAVTVLKLEKLAKSIVETSRGRARIGGGK